MIERTFFETSEDAERNRNWVIVDAADKPVGRLASQVAAILRGKTNPRYTPHTDTGSHVIVINAEKIRFTGSKPETKTYYRHTGFIGGIKTDNAGELLTNSPEEVIFRAVRGMLPKNPLGRAQLGKLKVYQGTEHKHQAQKPVPVSI